MSIKHHRKNLEVVNKRLKRLHKIYVSKGCGDLMTSDEKEIHLLRLQILDKQKSEILFNIKGQKLRDVYLNKERQFYSYSENKLCLYIVTEIKDYVRSFHFHITLLTPLDVVSDLRERIRHEVRTYFNHNAYLFIHVQLG